MLIEADKATEEQAVDITVRGIIPINSGLSAKRTKGLRKHLPALAAEGSEHFA
jgi:hypothetical protein